MTALSELARLECPARWWPEAGAEPRDVYLSVGEAELVVQDSGGTALAHWSLPALERRDAGGLPGRYAPAQGAAEEVEIEEPAMVEALDRVIAAVARGRRRPRAWRGLVLVAALAAALVAGALWLPGILRGQAAGAMPAVQRAQLGDRLLAELIARSGPRCTARAGSEALTRLRARLPGDGIGTIAVLRGLPPAAVALPGGIVALSDRTLAAHDDPDVVAGHILAAALDAQAHPPLTELLDSLSPIALARLLATGQVDDAAIAAHARRLLTRSAPRIEADALRTGFERAGLAWTPWAGATGLLDGPAGRTDALPALDDASWQALREICTG